MAIVDKLKSRLPGGMYYEPYRKTKALKGTQFEWIYQARKQRYWHGEASKDLQMLMQGLETFHKGNIYDFGIVKIPCGANELDMPVLFMDLIAPYLADTDVMCDEGPYEKYDVKVQEDDIVIDAGANIGVFTAFAAKHRGAVVHAFEPVEKTYCFLCRTIEVNDIAPRVYTVRAALSNHSGEEKMTINDNMGTSRLFRDTGNVAHDEHYIGEETVRLTTLDDYVRDNELERVDFIKADIEGSERNMLKGATETLKTFAPQLAICTYHLPDDPEVLTDIIKKANPRYDIKYGPKKLYAKVN